MLRVSTTVINTKSINKTDLFLLKIVSGTLGATTTLLVNTGHIGQHHQRVRIHLKKVNLISCLSSSANMTKHRVITVYHLLGVTRFLLIE